MAALLKKSRAVRNLVEKICVLDTGSSIQFQKRAPIGIRQSYETPLSICSNLSPFIVVKRFIGIEAQERVQNEDSDETPVLDFPGGRVTFTPEISFVSESLEKRTNCFRVLDDNGNPIMGSNFREVGKEVAINMYSNMIILQIMDTIFYEAQRQGRISFYLTTCGEEAINIASAAALSIDDVVFPQYREPGVLLWRGFSLQEFANQCFGNKADYGKGRQMPIHYGSNKLNYFTVSSPIATQIPHAVGAAYSLKMDQKKACTVTYFGDGGTSEGDFHAGLNFAAVMEVPVLFICRNNGWAISTPTSEQFRSIELSSHPHFQFLLLHHGLLENGYHWKIFPTVHSSAYNIHGGWVKRLFRDGDGAVVKGQAYGIRSIRVDGNDPLAIYNAVCEAREMAIKECRPILIEALTYRAGHHSTSDDSTKYRLVDEIEHWRTMRDPISRFRKWLDKKGWWSNLAESELRNDVRKKLLNAIQVAEKVEKPPVTDLFTDVYDKIPSNLQEQERLLRETIDKHPNDYPTDVPV